MSEPTEVDLKYYQNLPGKKIGVSVLLFYRGQLLIMQPAYKDAWILPDGIVEAEESPIEAIHREIKNALGIAIEPTGLIAIDYVHNRDVKGEYIQLLFTAKDLAEIRTQQITISSIDFKNYKFVFVEEALQLLTPIVARRVENAIKAIENNSGMIYLEDGGQPFFNAEIANL